MSTVRGTIHNLVLSDTTPGRYTSPLTIAASGLVSGLYGDATGTWQVTNAGKIEDGATFNPNAYQGEYYGISFAGSGIITNTGVIASDIYVRGNTSLNNSGTLSAGAIEELIGNATVVNTGVIATTLHVDGSGTLNNSGSIFGFASGVFSPSNPGSVYNTGTIGNYVASGEITNTHNGFIENVTGFTTLTNYGTIQSVNGGGNGASLDNVLFGSIGLVQIRGTATVINDGTITDNIATYGGTITNLIRAVAEGQVELFGSGTITNQQSAQIEGLVFASGSATATNLGTMSYGIFLDGGGSITNGSGGITEATIEGSTAAVNLQGKLSSRVGNFGSLEGVGAAGAGLLLSAPGTITNYAAGTITGSKAGAWFGAAAQGTLTNYGVISGTGSGAGILVSGTANVTLINYGTVSGAGTNGTGITLTGAGTLTLAERPGAALIGNVYGGGSGALILAGTRLDDIAGNVSGFAQITDAANVTGELGGIDMIPTGGTLTDGGTMSVYGTLTNYGATNVTGMLSVAGSTNAGGTVVSSGVMIADGPITGIVEIGNGGTLQVGGSVGAAGTVLFDGTLSGTLTLEQPQNFGGAIHGMQPFINLIDLPNVPYSNGTKTIGYAIESAGSVLTVNAANGTTYQLQMDPNGPSGDGYILRPDPTGGTEIEMVPLVQLAELSSDVYNVSPVGIPGTWFPIVTVTNGEAQVTAYTNQGDSQIVIAVRGTAFSSGFYVQGFKNLLSDIASVPTGNPTVGVTNIVSATAGLLSEIANEYPNATITLTGHSLGGGIAEIVGAASGYNTVVFNAVGMASLYTAVQGLLSPAAALKARNPRGGAILNIRVPGDVVSLLGIQEGSIETAISPAPPHPDTMTWFLLNHLVASAVIPTLEDPFVQLQPGVVEASSVLLKAADEAANGPSTTRAGGNILQYTFTADTLANYLIDPGSGSEFSFSETSGAPLIQSVVLPVDPDGTVASFEVSYMANGAWTPPQVVSNNYISFGSGTTAFEFEALSSTGQVVSLSNGYEFDATFVSSGQFNGDVESGDVTVPATPAAVTGDGVTDALMTNSNTGALFIDEVSGDPTMTYTQIGGLGPEWQFEGAGSFLDDGNIGELLSDGNSGAIVVAEDNAGTAQYTAIGSVGPEWKFEGNGAFLGQSSDDFLLWDGSSSSPNYGALVVGSVVNGTAQYSLIGALGPEWQFEGTGDYLGDGNAGFLIWDGSSASPGYGALFVGEDGSGAAQYSLVGGLGPEWQFEGSGDLLGLGQDDFLIWDGSSASPNYGALVVGEVVNGAAQYAQIGAIGPEWQFLGVGNYDGSSQAEFLMRNSNSGALLVGAINATSGTYGVTYEQVGGVGSEWNFHTSNIATVA